VVLGLLGLLPLAMIMVTDLETKMVPNLITLPSIGVMLLIGTLFGPAPLALPKWTWLTSIEGALVGFGVMRVLVWLGVAVFGEGALGEGDITLATYVGAFLGFPMVVEGLLLAFVLGGVGAFLVLLFRRGTLNTAIAYGPYIILGGTLTLLFGREIVYLLFVR
jgi:leader peptidase (prepilin peptidase)/N-methyltransferase